MGHNDLFQDSVIEYAQLCLLHLDMRNVSEEINPTLIFNALESTPDFKAVFQISAWNNFIDEAKP